MEFILFTDKGKLRTGNEDSLFFQTKNTSQLINENNQYSFFDLSDGDFLGVVSDGMGGYGGGELASKIACEEFQKEFANFESFPESDVSSRLLTSAFQKADHKILELSEKDSNLKNMGATVAGLLYSRKNGLIVFHAGDSRVYQMKGRYLKQLTNDHSVSNTYAGDFSSDSASRYLTNSLGGGGKKNNLEINSHSITELSQNEGFFICSDGVHEYIDIDLLEKIIDIPDFNKLIRALRDALYENQAPDNFTGIIIRKTNAT